MIIFSCFCCWSCSHICCTSHHMEHHTAMSKWHRARSNLSTVNDSEHLCLVTVPCIWAPCWWTSPFFYFNLVAIHVNYQEIFLKHRIEQCVTDSQFKPSLTSTLTALLPICLSAYRRSASELEFSWLKLNLNETKMRLEGKG